MSRPKTIKEKICPGCDKSFTPSSSIIKFCSASCAYQNKPKKGKWKKCTTCGAKIYLKQCEIKPKNYCSPKCFQTYTKTQSIIKYKKCVMCDKQIEYYNSYTKVRGPRKYCSKKCQGKAQKIKYQKARSENKPYPKKLTTYKKSTWNFFSKYIRNRDNWTCFTCGKYEKGPTMHAGHFISRGRSATMFDEKNVHAQCYSCNIGKKGNVAEYAYRITKIYGQDVLNELVERSRKTHKFTFEELESIQDRSKQQLKELMEQDNAKN